MPPDAFLNDRFARIIRMEISSTISALLVETKRLLPLCSVWAFGQTALLGARAFFTFFEEKQGLTVDFSSPSAGLAVVLDESQSYL